MPPLTPFLTAEPGGGACLTPAAARRRHLRKAKVDLALAVWGGVLALLSAGLVAQGKLLRQIEFQDSYLRKKTETMPLTSQDGCIH